MAGRSGGVYGLAQFCSVTVGTLAAGDNNIAAVVRWQGGANEACYFGDVYADSGGYKYAIMEVDNSFNITQLASTGTGGAVSSGVVATTEIDAGGNIGLYTDEGGTDTLRLSASDATLGAGVPGFVLFADGSATNARISSVSGGTLWQDIGDYLVAVGPQVNGTAGVTPLWVDGHAADDIAECILESCGGEAANLGTANGFAPAADSPSATGTTTNGTRLTKYWCRATGSSQAGPVVTDPGNHVVGFLRITRGCITTGDPYDDTAAAQKASASTSASAPEVTTTVADCIVFTDIARDNDAAGAGFSAWASTGGLSGGEISDIGTTDGNGGGIGSAAWIKPTAGATNGFTATVTSSINASHTGALKPPSTGVTVNLTGSSVTGSAGSVAGARSLPLAGLAVSSALGSLVFTRPISLVGESSASSLGSVSVARGADLVGQSVVVAQGSVSYSVAIALSGLSSSITTGDILSSIALAMTGLAAAVDQGTISAGGDITVNLTGLSSSAAIGTLSVSASIGLSGQAMTTTAGALAYSAALQLVGELLSTAQGFITTGSDVTVGITGQAMSAALGTLTPAQVAALTGSQMTASAGAVVAARSATLTGAQAGMSAGAVATLRALNLLGIPASISQGTVTYQEGQNVTVTLTGLAAAIQQASLLPSSDIGLLSNGITVLLGSIYAVIPPTGGSEAPVLSAEGTIASPNPWYSLVTDESPAGIAGENGCIMGRFAWLAADGSVTNARLSMTDQLCFVLMHSPGYGAVYWSNGRAVLHPGAIPSLMSFGDFWARFEYGAVQGAQVYAEKATGKPISGYAANAEATPWWVVTNAAPGELAIISTTSRVQ